MAEREADTVVILSSELISKITEEYFNKTMFKQKVEIVDLKPTETGYMFSVAFVQSVKKPVVHVDTTRWLESIPEEPVEKEQVEDTYYTPSPINEAYDKLNRLNSFSDDVAQTPKRASNGKFMKVRK